MTPIEGSINGQPVKPADQEMTRNEPNYFVIIRNRAKGGIALIIDTGNPNGIKVELKKGDIFDYQSQGLSIRLRGT